jgi:hypothetical protein
MENRMKTKEYKFPLAIKVNVWLVLIVPIMLLVLFVLAILINDTEFTDVVREIIYDDESPIQSILLDLQILIMPIVIWIIYFQKKHIQYIVKVFYIDYVITILFHLPIFFADETVFSMVFAILYGLPVLWLYMSKETQEFIRSVENS